MFSAMMNKGPTLSLFVIASCRNVFAAQAGK